MDLRLKDQVALVTGAAKGVGREIALALAREGAHVAVHYHRSEADAATVATEASGMEVRAAAYGCDVMDYAAVQTMVAKVRDDLGDISVLVNNAGYGKDQLFVESTPQDWAPQIGVCLGGVINCTRVALPGMVARRRGCIINIAGDSGRVGQVRLAVAGAARAGTMGFTKSIAKEYGRFNIRVNCVALGIVETEHIDPAFLEAHREKILRLYPLRRLGQPTDVAPLVAFLASDLAGWITGQTISVSGGYSTAG